MDSRDSEEALDITGEDLSQEHVGTESRSVNAYGSPVNVGERNLNTITTARREDVAEPRSDVVSRVVRKSNFVIIASVCSFRSF